MCNLYASSLPQDAMRVLFDVAPERDRLGNAAPLRAIFPRHRAPIVRTDGAGARELVAAHWGFVIPQTSERTGKPVQPKAVTNARDDKVRHARFWRTPFETRRCLIPATSFCEPKGKRPAVYHWFRVDDADAFAFAGIWQHYRGLYASERVGIDVYAMLTTEPNATVAPIHPTRMPVILDGRDYATWLAGTPDQAAALLRPFPAERMTVAHAGEALKEEPAQP